MSFYEPQDKYFYRMVILVTIVAAQWVAIWGLRFGWWPW